MARLLPGSPAKVERVERHLARQRGAGVRNLATSFGFSFALSTVPTSVHHDLEEPPAKRRKSAHSNPEKVIVAAEGVATCPSKTPVGKKAKVRRRFETVAEDEDKVVAVRTERRDSFSATAKKKRGRPKIPEIHVELGEKQVAVILPERRSKRRAAASAIAKVTKGFAEEDAPIDKKRRDPEPEKPSKRGRKRIETAAAVEDVHVDTNLEPGQNRKTQGMGQEVHDAEIATKTNEATLFKKRKQKGMVSRDERVPLGETDVNISSKSPKKLDKFPPTQAAKSCPPTSPVTKLVTQKTVQKRRNLELSLEMFAPLKTGKKDVEVSRSTFADSKAQKPVRRETVSSLRSRKVAVGKVEKDRLPSPAIEQSEILMTKASQKFKVPPIPDCADMHAQPKKRQKSASESASPHKAHHLDQKAEKRSRPRQGGVPSIPGTKSRPPTTKLVEATISPHQDDDVDWLFDIAKKPNLHPGRPKRNAPTKLALRATDEDLDDEMLSNIASWAR